MNVIAAHKSISHVLNTCLLFQVLYMFDFPHNTCYSCTLGLIAMMWTEKQWTFNVSARKLNYHLWVYFHFFFSRCFWWNKKLGYKNQKTKYPDCQAYHTVCLEYCLVLTLWEGTSALLYIPNGSVELVCLSAGVYLELALALMQSVSHLDLVMTKSTFDHVWLGLGLMVRGYGTGLGIFIFSLCNWLIVHVGTDLVTMAKFVLCLS